MLTNYISISLNGQPFNCALDLSLLDLLSYLSFDVDFVIVEYNNEIVQSVALHAIPLTHGDKVEILSIVGGG